MVLKDGLHVGEDLVPEGFVFAAGAFLQHQLAFLPVRTDIFHDLPLIRLRVTLFQEFLTPAAD